jgi:hypothetical protein
MPAIGRQSAPITGHHIYGRKITDQRHGNAPGAGKPSKLNIKGIAGRDPDDATPFPGIGGHDRTRFISGQAHKIADFRDHDLGAIRPRVYPHEDFPGQYRFGQSCFTDALKATNLKISLMGQPIEWK